jgi:hypothetical protein
VSRVARIQLAAPLPHQEPVLAHMARFKLLCWGRRTGKSRVSWAMSWLGHGPLADGVPMHRGILQGLDVAWIARDYTQSLGLWEEEVVPRFRDVPGFYLNEQKKCVRAPRLGTLWIKSYENIDSVRGIGARLGGVVAEECAHWDLQYGWRKVLRPALMDNRGWAAFPSSPNYGTDGNKLQRTPSYFNILCDEVASGTRGPEWELWDGDARMNPKIAPEEFEALVAEYAPDSDDLKQEVYGMRLTTGQGLAFPEFHRHYHVKEREPGPDDVAGAGMDWGYSSPGWFGLGFVGARDTLLRHELYFRGKGPRRVGREVAAICLAAASSPREIVADSAIFATTDGGVTIAERVQEGIEAAWAEAADGRRELPPVPQLVPSPKGPGSIRTRTQLLKEALAYRLDDDGALVEPPALVVHPSCVEFLRIVSTIPLHPKKREEFNTDVEDHPIDGWTYFLSARSAEFAGSRAEERETKARRQKLDPLSRREDVEWEKMEKELTKRGKVRA